MLPLYHTPTPKSIGFCVGSAFFSAAGSGRPVAGQQDNGQQDSGGTGQRGGGLLDGGMAGWRDYGVRYSFRSAATGSMCAARQAGRKLAMVQNTITIPATTAISEGTTFHGIFEKP